MSIEECKKGTHQLLVVSRKGPEMEEEVVRWCQVCGSIVIDLECDNRVQPGAVYSMKTPQYVKENA